MNISSLDLIYDSLLHSNSLQKWLYFEMVHEKGVRPKQTHFNDKYLGVWKNLQDFHIPWWSKKKILEEYYHFIISYLSDRFLANSS